jgi:hypothetical protein
MREWTAIKGARMHRNGSRYRLATFLTLIPFALGACGLLFTHGPPAGYEHLESFSCTQSNTGPVIDVVWAALNVAGALVVAGSPDQYENPDQAEASGIFWGVLSGVAAGVGFDKVKKCVAAKRDLAERQAKARATAPVPPISSGDIQTVQVAPGVDTLVVGGGVQLVANALDSSGAAVVHPAFTWSSSNDAIASVTNSGRVTAHAPGSVIVAANAANVVGTARIVVLARR